MEDARVKTRRKGRHKCRRNSQAHGGVGAGRSKGWCGATGQASGMREKRHCGWTLGIHPHKDAGFHCE